ncbi:L-Aspartase-like protein [Gymnopilus junonius]|uniref:L-Aspartase-like protein n=1 Tax=Gymnopilus junonius TaxID=109634 RepID=A0A9P5NQA7_GYMJU|nr:L-Aspartase-like protein [Gymnopilus junonius]
MFHHSTVSTAPEASQLQTIGDYLSEDRTVTIDGASLDVASVIAVCRHNYMPFIDDSDLRKTRVGAAVNVVQDLALGEQSQYGVTTGFGGSATTRTKRTALLQKSLLATCQCGILPSFEGEFTANDHALMMPQEWIRGTMFVRLNSIIRAQSGTRWIVIEGLYKLLCHGVAPCAPLRQSISASGDLGPLSYISSVLTGNPDIRAWYGSGQERKIYDAKTLLEKLNIQPVEYIAKEGLGLVNGTGASTAVAALAIHDCHSLAIASQVLSAFVAANIRYILQTSKLAKVQHEEADPEGKLRQDRYCIRGAPQWIGPQLETLLAAEKGIKGHFLHHGANFMAMSRLALAHLAKLTYSQFTELLNNHMNRGLPPNLSINEPSLDYSLKVADVAAASYLSEIAYLANPVSTHVVSAEMHNQAINSLALISARYTFEAIKITRMIMATHLYGLCQAVDLRAMEAIFREGLFSMLKTETLSHFGGFLVIDENFLRALTDQVVVLLNETTDQDSAPRFEKITSALTSTLIGLFGAQKPPLEISLAQIEAWRSSLSVKALNIYLAARDNYRPGPESLAANLLGRTNILYKFMRGELGVLIHWGDPTRDTTEIGTEIGKIFRAFESPRINEVLLEVLVGQVTK